MKKFVFVFLIFLTMFNAYGQKDTSKDSIPQIQLLNPRPMNEQLSNYLQMDKPQVEDTLFRLDIITPLEKPAPKPIDFVVPPLRTYQGPPLSTDNLLIPHFPFAENYAYGGFALLSDRAWLTSISTNQRYPLLGRIRSVNVQLNYKLTDWMYISGGPYASKYDTYSAQMNDFGINGSMKFIVSDRVRFNAYGQRSFNAGKNGIGGSLMDVFPTTYYGGTMEFKISDKFGIEAGMIRELNPFTGKWENKPIISPVFY